MCLKGSGHAGRVHVFKPTRQVRFPAILRPEQRPRLRPGRVGTRCQRFRPSPRGLTMKRKLAPWGRTLPRSSLWRFTYSLIKLTSSSCGNKSALKPEVSNSSQSSPSHSFQPAPGVSRSDRPYQSRAKGLASSMVHRPRTGQCARAAPPRALPIYAAKLGPAPPGAEGEVRPGCRMGQVRLP